MRPYNRFKREMYTKKRENLFFIQKRERRSKRVLSGVDKKGLYSTIKVTTDYTSVLCRKNDRKKRIV